MAAVPDDLGGLVELLPSLRTGEAIVTGEAMPIPSRIRVRRSSQELGGDDPSFPEVWRKGVRPPRELYSRALRNWRAQTLLTQDAD